MVLQQGRGAERPHKFASHAPSTPWDRCKYNASIRRFKDLYIDPANIIFGMGIAAILILLNFGHIGHIGK